jgi:beta-galactosidase
VPGAFREVPALDGGLIWEWLERKRQLLRQAAASPSPAVGKQVHGGNLVTDKPADADRNPRPGLLDVKKVEPQRITVSTDWSGFTARNGQDFADTGACSFRHAVPADGGPPDTVAWTSLPGHLSPRQL